MTPLHIKSGDIKSAVSTADMARGSWVSMTPVEEGMPTQVNRLEKAQDGTESQEVTPGWTYEGASLALPAPLLPVSPEVSSFPLL